MRGLVLAFLFVSFGIQTYAQSGCPTLEAPKPDTSIILSPKQETALGAIMTEELSSRFDVIDDEALTGYLTRVGNRVAAQLHKQDCNTASRLRSTPRRNQSTFWRARSSSGRGLRPGAKAGGVLQSQFGLDVWGKKRPAND
jgi:hypothetical protein